MNLVNFSFSDDSKQSPELTQFLNQVVMENPVLASAKADGRLGILFADISEGRIPTWAALDPDLEIYGASVPKLGILLGILQHHATGGDFRKNILSDFESSITAMIKKSDNLESGKLYALASFDSIHSALSQHGLYEWEETTGTGRGGMWCGVAYNTPATKKWFEDNPAYSEKYRPDFAARLSPKSGQEFSLTVRAGASFLLKMVQGRLIDRKYSDIAKDFLRQISTSKFAKGLLTSDPEAIWYGKTGTYNGHLAEVSLVEGCEYRFILAVQLSNHRSNDVFEYVAQKVVNFVRSTSHISGDS